MGVNCCECCSLKHFFANPRLSIFWGSKVKSLLFLHRQYPIKDFFIDFFREKNKHWQFETLVKLEMKNESVLLYQVLRIRIIRPSISDHFHSQSLTLTPLGIFFFCTFKLYFAVFYPTFVWIRSIAGSESRSRSK